VLVCRAGSRPHQRPGMEEQFAVEAGAGLENVYASESSR